VRTRAGAAGSGPGSEALERVEHEVEARLELVAERVAGPLHLHRGDLDQVGEAADALRRLEAGDARGKLVIEVV
jgi:hypothetical protein